MAPELLGQTVGLDCGVHDPTSPPAGDLLVQSAPIAIDVSRLFQGRHRATARNGSSANGSRDLRPIERSKAVQSCLCALRRVPRRRLAPSWATGCGCGVWSVVAGRTPGRCQIRALVRRSRGTQPPWRTRLPLTASRAPDQGGRSPRRGDPHPCSGRPALPPAARSQEMCSTRSDNAGSSDSRESPCDSKARPRATM